MTLYKQANDGTYSGPVTDTEEAAARANSSSATPTILLTQTTIPGVGTADAIMSPNDTSALLALWATNATKGQQESLRSAARAALLVCKEVAIGAFMVGAAYPAAWQVYALAARKTLQDGVTPLPVQPALPIGVVLSS